MRGFRFLISALVLIAGLLAAEAVQAAEPFAWRGYYFILSRNPDYGLDDYKLILDRMAEDRANILILWIGGGFPSRRYPETWDYNRDHKNCRENFAGALIDHAHKVGIRVVLGLTPFAYDGVNRYGAAHPELGAVDPAGKPSVTGGIHSFGRGLCPSKEPAQAFMLDYCRELYEEFYPQADGFFLEHSDYGTCRCPACSAGKGFLEKEWRFVDALSRRVWAAKPGAVMMVGPHYATIGIEFDPRHVVFCAPHNMPGWDKVKNPRVLWNGYWEVGGLFRELCRHAAKTGFAGVIPSMENFTYENSHAFDTRWGPPGARGWDDLLVRLTRLSFRASAERPEIADDQFNQAVKAAFFEADAPPSAVADLLTLHRHLNRWEGWTWRGGVMKLPPAPVDLKAMDPPTRKKMEEEVELPLREIAAIHDRARAAAKSSTGRSAETFRRMEAISGWVLAGWEGKL